MFLLSLSVVQVQVLIFDYSDTAWAGGDIIAAFQNNHVITTIQAWHLVRFLWKRQKSSESSTSRIHHTENSMIATEVLGTFRCVFSI